ncbi:hypothetical protein ACFSTI_26970 [Rhizorhabdus histidinilytica]
MANRDRHVADTALAQPQASRTIAIMLSPEARPAELEFGAITDSEAGEQIAEQQCVVALAGLAIERPIRQPQLDRDMAPVDRAGRRAETGPVRAIIAHLRRSARGQRHRKQSQQPRDHDESLPRDVPH